MNSNDPVQSKPFVPTLNPRIEMDERPIGKGTTTLDMLKHNHPWLAEMIDQYEVDVNELRLELRMVLDANRELLEQIKRLRQKNHNQRGELRRLNDAILRKNARVNNVEFHAVKAEALLEEFVAHVQAGNIIIR